MNDRDADRWTQIVALVPLVGAIAYLRLVKQVPLDAFIFGTGSWGFALMLKMAVYHGLVRKLPHDPAHLARTSLLHGAISGVCELGMALAAFAYLKTLTLPEVLAFGTAIGALEAMLPSNVLEGTELAPAMKRFERMLGELRGFSRLYHRCFLPALERWAATGIHIGTRGLVYVGLATMNPLPWVVALAPFVVAEGVLGYRLIYSGKIDTPAAFRRLESQILGIAAAAVALFLLFWRLADFPG